MTEKQEFAHTLRGVAAISVMIAHYCGTFFIHQNYIAILLQVSPLIRPPVRSSISLLINDWSSELGQFGVGVFFIISGFVIPFSLTSTSYLEFLRRRALRIYPVYIAGFSLVMCSICLLTRYAGTDFTYSFGHMLSHLGIISRGFTEYSRIDGISWTLEVEVWFYVVIATIGIRALSRGPVVLCAGAIAVALAAIISSELRLRGFTAVGHSAQHFWASLLLVLGLGYHALFQKNLSMNSFLILQITVASLIVLVWYLSFPDEFYVGWLVGYFIAMAVFACAYALRRHIKRNRILYHFADISYPLYVVHALTGYAVMYLVVSQGGGSNFAIISAVLFAYLLAVLLHYLVEKPFMKLGKSSSPKPSGTTTVRSIV